MQVERAVAARLSPVRNPSQQRLAAVCHFAGWGAMLPCLIIARVGREWFFRTRLRLLANAPGQFVPPGAFTFPFALSGSA